MKFALILASLFAGASAFAPSGSASTTKSALDATKSDLEAIAAKANPKVGFYDPMNLAEKDFWGKGNEATIGFLRQSEIKVRHMGRTLVQPVGKDKCHFCAANLN